MQYRKLGDTDLELSVVTFGAWAAGGWMWGGTEQNNAIEAIHASYDLGVTSIDTAPVYGQGHSEKIVGEAIKDLPRDKVQILTKYGLRWDTDKGKFYFKSKDNDGNDIDIHKYAGKEAIIKECEESLKRLGTDYIDLYQIHWADPTTPISETMEAVAQLKEQGKIREAGVCNYNVDQMKTAEKTIKLASNQVPYSMVRRDIEEEVVPYCIKNNKGILAYSPFQRGLLTGKMSPGYEFGEGDTRANEIYYTDENIQRTNEMLEKIKPIAEEKGATLPQLVIQWTIQQPGITIALVGARTPEQSTQNAKAADLKLLPDEIKFIDNQIKELELETA
ncbi:aldo/keto reductase [Aliifodinibius sp. S!AR15-10]|uniref:aldo/keto reductase n=1 Tax=Aliifodinibius sp. S!AR15-10 TaxID=2950437 RepID=UPI002858AD06|nr:aldo/keto reductase [Aliifodinibius sp. S!AR15-10]MDR8392877.1 aldo/keto reductase [Aliifodinibius sp. S!AR15-10]